MILVLVSKMRQTSTGFQQPQLLGGGITIHDRHVAIHEDQIVTILRQLIQGKLTIFSDFRYDIKCKYSPIHLPLFSKRGAANFKQRSFFILKNNGLSQIGDCFIAKIPYTEVQWGNGCNRIEIISSCWRSG